MVLHSTQDSDRMGVLGTQKEVWAPEGPYVQLVLDRGPWGPFPLIKDDLLVHLRGFLSYWV